ncbi:hypothetical protein EG327_009200 [Venturia inaequalis]|uniref:Uncharacterized protein n=1 Tax=Venturia inaequalis TaxID=5025 RepID=A0A8H3VVV7_VENIN|nr:hypothetical protein EG327_009200 [Venturia inaequalis]
MDPLLCDQFQSLAADDIRSFLVDGSHHHPSAIDWLLYELDAITKSRAPGGIKDYTRYLNEVLCSYELSWYQEQNATQITRIGTLPLLFPGSEPAEETIRLLLYVRHHNTFVKDLKSRHSCYCTLQVTKAINTILTNASYKFSHAFLSDIIAHTRAQYEQLRFKFEEAEKIRGSLATVPFMFAFNTQTSREEKVEEDLALGKCPSTQCPLRRMLNRYIAVVHHEVSVVAHCNGLPKELRGMVFGWTLAVEDIEAREVYVGKWEVTHCPCGDAMPLIQDSAPALV